MLKLNTSYFLRHKGHEKIITINNQQDQEYWSKYVGQEGYEFSEVVANEPKGGVCISCEG